MSRRRRTSERFLRWYPLRWRERYGEEMVALLDDSLARRRPGLRLWCGVASAGCRQRVRAARTFSSRATACELRRAGSLIVLGAWSAFVVGGAGFAKASEHFSSSLTSRTRSWPQVTYDVVVAAGVGGFLLVGVAALALVPSLVRHLRRGGARTTLRELRPAAATILLASLATVGLDRWAHRLTSLQRNGGDGFYSLAYVAWGIIGFLAVALVTICVVNVVRTMELSSRLLRVEAALARVVAVTMFVATGAALSWWVVMDQRAPAFLTGSSRGAPAGGWPLNLLAALTVMMSAFAIATLGARLSARGAARRHLERAIGT